MTTLTQRCIQMDNKLLNYYCIIVLLYYCIIIVPHAHVEVLLD